MDSSNGESVASIALRGGSYILGWLAVASVALIEIEIANAAGYYSGIFNGYLYLICVILLILVGYMVIATIYASIKLIKLTRMKKRGLT